MVLVTDKKYYMEKALKENLDFCIERSDEKSKDGGWDNALIMDGMERAGKSTLGRQVGHYISYKKGKPFSHENIFFDPEQMFLFATSTRGMVIIWDEAALGGMSEDRYKEAQQLIIKMLITCGKFNHTYIFIIPKIRKLSDYIAEDRSIALLRVYSPDMRRRGFFLSFCKWKKDAISQLDRKKQNSKHIKYDFRGRFMSYEGTDREVIDMDEYEKKKNEAIENLRARDNKKLKYLLYIAKIAEHLKKNKILKKKEVAEIIGVDASFMSRLPKVK